MSAKTLSPAKQIKRHFLLFMAVWSVGIAASLAWNWRQLVEAHQKPAHSSKVGRMAHLWWAVPTLRLCE